MLYIINYKHRWSYYASIILYVHIYIYIMYTHIIYLYINSVLMFRSQIWPPQKLQSGERSEGNKRTGTWQNCFHCSRESAGSAAKSFRQEGFILIEKKVYEPPTGVTSTSCRLSAWLHLFHHWVKTKSVQENHSQILPMAQDLFTPKYIVSDRESISPAASF